MERVRVRGKHHSLLTPLTPALSKRSGREREKDEPSVVLDWTVTEKLVFLAPYLIHMLYASRFTLPRPSTLLREFLAKTLFTLCNSTDHLPIHIDEGVGQ